MRSSGSGMPYIHKTCLNYSALALEKVLKRYTHVSRRQKIWTTCCWCSSTVLISKTLVAFTGCAAILHALFLVVAFGSNFEFIYCLTFISHIRTDFTIDCQQNSKMNCGQLVDRQYFQTLDITTVSQLLSSKVNILLC